MFECDLISEVVLNASNDAKALRVGRVEYPVWQGAAGMRLKCRIDDLVIKLDTDSNGQSVKERRMSSKIQIPDRKHFVEVIHFGVAPDTIKRDWYWVAQPYVPEVAHTPTLDKVVIDKASKKLRVLCELYNVSDIGAYGHNWTIVDGEPLIYDYGFGQGGNQFKKT